MELVVKSLQGCFVVTGLEPDSTVADLKRTLHQQHGQLPEPEEQCLVLRHTVLASGDAALEQLGITHGDQLVMLATRPTFKKPRAQTTPAADTAAIRAAITEEARCRGIEHTLKEERPPVARRGLRLPADLLSAPNDELLQLLQQAFDGSLPGLRLSVGGEGQAQDQAEPEQEGELQIPEPPADRISQLTDMGFSEALARNALLLHRSNIEAALEWLLEHADDPSAAEPPTQEQLRQVYGRRRGRPAGRGSLAGLRPEVLLSQLTDMGFDPAAAQSVLSRVGPSLELAVQVLLGGSGGGAAAGAGAGAGASVSAGGAAASAASAQGSPADTDATAGAGDGSTAAAATQAQDSRSSSAELSAQTASGSDSEPQGASAVAGSSETAAAAAEEQPAAAGAVAAAGASPRMHSEAEEDDEFEDGDEDEGEYEDDEDEDEYFDNDDNDDDDDDDDDNDDDALYDLPIGGTVQLANLGSADMEQLLQGANLQELTLGNQLLMPGGMDAGLAGPQSTLLRLLESPAFLEQVTAGMQALQGSAEQQQTPTHEEQQQQNSDGSGT